MRDKVLRRFGFATLREISWRASDDDRQFVGNAHRNHVAFDLLAEANAGIETFGDDVGERLVEGQVQRNFRILREKSRNSRVQKKIAGWRRRRDAQHAGRLAAEFIRSIPMQTDTRQGPAEAAPEDARRRNSPLRLFQLTDHTDSRPSYARCNYRALRRIAMSKPKLAIVIGSIRPNRFGGHAAQWIEEIARRRADFEVELIEV